MNKTSMAKAEKNSKPHQVPKGVTLLAKPLDRDNDFKCVRCDHEWQSRLGHKNKLPERCPHCSSPFWNKHYVRSRVGRLGQPNVARLPSALPPSMQP